MNIDRVFYRPVWTCGKYNATKHVAIMFNLLANSEYFFENDSADVINIILNVGRNGCVFPQEVSKELDISINSILSFFDTLIECGVLLDTVPTEETVFFYREQCTNNQMETSYVGEKVVEFTKNSIGTAELAYMTAVEDCCKITSVMFELTYNCSENCLHCYNPKANRANCQIHHKELNVIDYKRIIDEMCDAGLVSANLSGGDPFAYYGVWEIIDYLFKKDIAITIFTNGLKLHDDVDKIAAFYPKEIKVSIYSSLPHVHDAITRVKGSLQRTINTITKLRQRAIPITINCILMRPAVNSYMNIKHIAELLKCNVGFDVCLTNAIDGNDFATRHLRLAPDELDVVLRDNDVFPISEFDINVSNCEDHTPCRAGFLNYCVTPTGDLIPCCAFHLVFGNLTKDTFNSIVSHNKVLKDWKESSYKDYEECFSHDYCSCCTLCPGNNYNEHGTPFKPGENNCYIARARYSAIKTMGKRDSQKLPKN